eukprot:120604-Rhodomonas_salina.1
MSAEEWRTRRRSSRRPRRLLLRSLSLPPSLSPSLPLSLTSSAYCAEQAALTRGGWSSQRSTLSAKTPSPSKLT